MATKKNLTDKMQMEVKRFEIIFEIIVDIFMI